MKTTGDPVAMLTTLVNCRTHRGEGEQAALLASWLDAWGGRTTVHEVAPGRVNLIATFPGREPSRSLMLEAHGDTVAEPCCDPYVSNGLLHGRGACDCKGPMTAMLLAIRDVLERDGQPPVTVHFVSTCDEELGATGAQALMRAGFRVDAAVVAEPTALKIVPAHKGALRLIVRTRGAAAHSSEPSRGINAIYQMGAVLRTIETRVIPALEEVRHPRLGSATLSVGVIRGGTQVNVVPAQCEIEVDRRLLPGEDRATIVRDLVRTLGVEGEATIYYPPLDQPLDSPICRWAAEACRRVLGAAPFEAAPYATNAGIFQAGGIPCIVFGPGSIAQAHKPDEYIELAQIDRAARVYADMIRSFT